MYLFQFSKNFSFSTIFQYIFKQNINTIQCSKEKVSWIAIPVVVILGSIPWLLPWDEINVAYLPTFHVISSVAPWIGSTLYHLFMNHNTGYIAYKVLLTIDLLGIWVTQTAGKLKLIIHLCQQNLRKNDCVR